MILPHDVRLSSCLFPPFVCTSAFIYSMCTSILERNSLVCLSPQQRGDTRAGQGPRSVARSQLESPPALSWLRVSTVGTLWHRRAGGKYTGEEEMKAHKLNLRSYWRWTTEPTYNQRIYKFTQSDYRPQTSTRGSVWLPCNAKQQRDTGRTRSSTVFYVIQVCAHIFLWPTENCIPSIKVKKLRSVVIWGLCPCISQVKR